jgi:putative colanic acid biosynthesis UDP-glucose lipid carrier transferase
MHVNRECHSRTSVKNDHRITRLGRFLRRTNIDEFPQFLNVLKGEMSVIGPRPHMHADCSRFSQVVFGYKFRNLVKPGITGLAQVKGYHGPAITYESIFRRFQWDAFYVRNASFWLDLRILKQTILQRI